MPRWPGAPAWGDSFDNEALPSLEEVKWKLANENFVWREGGGGFKVLLTVAVASAWNDLRVIC